MKLTATIASISLISLSSILLSGCTPTEAAAPQPQAQSSLAQEINCPEVPQKMKLCGKDVDLDRVDMWERLDRELSSMVYTHANTMLTIKRANKYFPVMAPILKKNGVHSDILYLACIESYLNPRAYSGAKAAGIWQFMPATAKEYGLEVSDEIDERYHLEKATEAACKYMKKAYAKYGNWESVMSAYNGGMGRVSKELGAQGTNSAFDLYLTDETSRYPFRVMAMKEIMENPTKYGFNLRADQLYQPLECTEVTVSEPVEDWAAWAKDQGISYAQLREANPWIRAKKLTNKTGKTYTVKVPTKTSLSRSRQKKQVFNSAWIGR